MNKEDRKDGNHETSEREVLVAGRHLCWVTKGIAFKVSLGSDSLGVCGHHDLLLRFIIIIVCNSLMCSFHNFSTPFFYNLWQFLAYHNQKVYRYIQYRLLALIYPTQAVRFWRFKKDCAAWPVNKWFSHWRNQVVHMVSQCAFRCGVKEGVQLDGMHLFLTDWCRNCSLFRTVCHYSIEFCPGSGSVTIFCALCTLWTLGVTRFLRKETIFSEVFASDWEVAIVNAGLCGFIVKNTLDCTCF